MTHWFLVQVWPTMFRTLIAAGTGAIAAVVVVAPIKRGLHSLGHRVGAAIDSLDPDVPVGLTKQLDDMKGQLQHLNEHVGGTLTVHPVDRDGDDHVPIVHHGR